MPKEVTQNKKENNQKLSIFFKCQKNTQGSKTGKDKRTINNKQKTNKNNTMERINPSHVVLL